MFYCKKCKEEKGWPWTASRSKGRCEVCGEADDCFNAPVTALHFKPITDEPVFKLARYDAQAEAIGLLDAARAGHVVEVSNWEVMEALVKLLERPDHAALRPSFYRDDPKRRVEYDLAQMRICLDHGIECR